MNTIPSVARRGVRNGLLTAAYIVVVVSVMSNNENFLPQKPELLAGMFMLLLFVVSALITSSLVLWQPIKLLIDGKTSEAAVSLFAAGAALAGVLVVVVLALIIS